MEYKQGSYIILANKEWICKKCEQKIPIKRHHFVRIKILGEEISKKTGNSFVKKQFKRFHLECALTLNDLNDYEKDIINKTLNKQNNLPEGELQTKISNMLRNLENNNKLSFLRVIVGKFNQRNKEYSIGRKGFSDFIIFLKGGKALFVELKRTKNNNTSQNGFKEKITRLGYKYYIVSSTSEMDYILNNI